MPGYVPCCIAESILLPAYPAACDQQEKNDYVNRINDIYYFVK